jgi:TetR/AcrR family transcriptional regulator, transcriptional repressor for nem operon
MVASQVWRRPSVADRQDLAVLEYASNNAKIRTCLLNPVQHIHRMSDSRQRIRFAAMRLFAEKGYGSTSVADILQAAGVNSGSLYYVYPSKQDVLLDVLDTYLTSIDPGLLQPAWEGVTDPIERVFALVQGYRVALESSECTFACPIGRLALELHEPDPSVRQRLAANFDAWISGIAQCFIDAGDRLPADTDRHALAVFAFTTMQGGVMLSRTHRSLDSFDAALKMLRAHVDMLEERAAAAR